ncbi:glycoside hydrolase family 99-like domain-containing protein [Humibacter sp.]|uniref:glycosyltransferase WbsX family protein n=1 Tax=Humibacter sp. TaxID=1940291 RepID=UPI002C2CCCA1|nr:glycoside hydrolase family 99-like domain-containing protein [Humibacter sp.]HVX07916.1 glycoside hydrolase family 99-like domain-containing protein [Humibacter sp.]
MADAMPNAHAIAYYLPQYHPFPENDEHWGTGFTEWANVVRAKRLFPGHDQPHLPTDLGFYDLRVPEVRAQQRDLALEAGISAFAVYHYWFEGRRLMHRPVDEMFADPVHPVKNLLCWANGSWTLEWRGRENVTTIEQTYSETDDWKHSELLAERFICNERYFTHEGRPVFLVYEPYALPERARMVRILREVCGAHGVELLVGGCVAFNDSKDVRELGLDFEVRWAPDWMLIREAFDPRVQRILSLQSRFLSKRWPRFRHNDAFSYQRVIDAHLASTQPAWPTCESAFPSWDNTARRSFGDAVIVTDPSPAEFTRWLRALRDRLRPTDPPFVFINAWNEWAEGCHLEPDETWGHAWLDACREVFTAL